MKMKVLPLTIMITLAALCCYGLLSINAGSIALAGKDPLADHYKGKKVKVKVDAKEIRKAITRSVSKKVMLNLYPVKLSSDMSKNDITLKVFFQDAEAPYKAISPAYNTKEIKKQFGWYARYLKKKKVIGKNIPSGYFITIDNEFMNGTNAVVFTLAAEEGEVGYCKEPDTPASSLPDADDKKDDKKEPDCDCLPEEEKVLCLLEAARYDSTGKCPPECPAAYMLYTPQMKSAINATFRIYKPFNSTGVINKN